MVEEEKGIATFEETEQKEGAPEQTEEKKLEEKAEDEVKEEGIQPGDVKYTNAVQKRIDQLTYEKHEALRKAEQLEARLAEVETKAVESERPARPRRQDYEDENGEVNEDKYQDAQDDYQEKLADWREKKKEAGTRATKVEQGKINLASTFKTKTELLKDKYPDIDEVINRPVFTPAMQVALFESEAGAEICYYLGKNESEAMRIGNLTDSQVLKEIGKLELKFSNGLLGKKTTGAPKPINPLKGKDAPQGKKKTAEEIFYGKS